ncbi:MAG: transcription termination factor NusA [Vicinamibacteria bacterium]
MSNLLYQTIEQISREKGIDPDVIIGAVEDAIITATKKYYRTEEDLKARLNRESGNIEVYTLKTVVDTVVDPNSEISLRDATKIQPTAELNQEVEVHKPTAALGRIAAQTAKQVIFQKVREAERDNIFSEFGDRIAQLLTGMVKRTENGDLVVDLGRTEAVLPRREQSRAEVFNAGDRIRVVIVRVLRTSRGPQVVVSRTDPALLARLFEMEVPEIYEGTVIVKNAVREPGDRAKVAVYSRDKDVDPVGACVGIKGSRVQNIIRELRGEKIDIVEWSEDPRTFAINALNPAKVSRVSVVDEKEKVMEVIVEEKQLSLAIGKKGQNVRLAARLIGWRIDIKSEEEKKQEVQSQMDAMSATPTPLEALSGVSEKVMQKLVEHGFTSVEELASVDTDVLTEIPGVGAKTAERIVSSARAWREGTSPEPLEDIEPPTVEESREEEALVAPELAEEALSQIGEPDRQPEMAESDPDGSGGER